MKTLDNHADAQSRRHMLNQLHKQARNKHEFSAESNEAVDDCRDAAQSSETNERC